MKQGHCVTTSREDLTIFQENTQVLKVHFYNCSALTDKVHHMITSCQVKYVENAANSYSYALQLMVTQADIFWIRQLT
jgi:hypothetical protein